MVMESQADALNQLTGDDLDGQVKKIPIKKLNELIK